MNMLKKIVTTIMMLCIGMMIFPMSAKASETDTLTFIYAYDAQRTGNGLPMTMDRFKFPYGVKEEQRSAYEGSWKLEKIGTWGTIKANNHTLGSSVKFTDFIEDNYGSSDDVMIWELKENGASILHGVLIAKSDDDSKAVFIGVGKWNEYGYYLCNTELGTGIDKISVDKTDSSYTFTLSQNESGTSTTEYTITFNANGGQVSPGSYQTNAEGKLTNFPTPTREGYTFVGWFTAAGKKITTDTVFDTNKTIYAHWTANSGGSTPPPTPTTPTTPPTPPTTTTESTPAEAPAQQQEAEPEVVAYIPAMKTTNVNGTQLEGWTSIEKAIPTLTQDKQQDVNGANKDLLHIDVSGFNKTIPASVIKVTDKATSIAGLHVFIGNSDAITFFAKNDLSGYKETNFEHKDTIAEHSRTIEFTHKQDLGTTVMFHTTVPAKSTRVTIYKVDADNNRTRIGRTSSNANGQVCFGINETGTFVLEY